MSQFSDLVATVTDIVKRPDLATRIGYFVRAATLKAHQSQYFFRDLKESGIEFTTPAYVQNFDPRTIYPYFRHPKYLRKHDGDITHRPGMFLKFVQIESSDDAYENIKSDVFYMAGQLMQIRSSTVMQYALLGVYENPVLTPDASYSSWIATDYPNVIVFEAIRQAFKSIGFDEQAVYWDKTVAEEYRNLMISMGTDEIPT